MVARCSRVLGAAVYGGIALATPPTGRDHARTFGVARFDDIDATTKTDIDPGTATDFWQARINTKGASDVYVLQNTIVPGGTFGWHSHPGPEPRDRQVRHGDVLHGDDPDLHARTSCRPGQGFVDNGHDTHVVRNEGTVHLVTVVVSLVPAGFAAADRRDRRPRTAPTSRTADLSAGGRLTRPPASIAIGWHCSID